jgi:hypothetical protein
MPVNHATCKRFKDTWAAPGSQLYAALEDGDRKKAAAIYDECEKRLAQEQGRLTYFTSDGTMMAIKPDGSVSRSIFDDVDA